MNSVNLTKHIMKILVTGGNGQLGNEIRKLSVGYDIHKFIFIDIDDLDLTDDEHVEKYIRSERPDVIIHCAAYTAVDKAEQEKELAMKLNASVPGNIARIIHGSGTKLIHISTDFVFNGKHDVPYIESDTPDPQSVYAYSKFMGEEEIRKQNVQGLIIRTSWLYSEYGVNFVKTILKKSRELKELRVVFDQAGTPTYAFDLATVILQILPEIQAQKTMEIFHYSNEGVASWYDFAEAIVEISGIQCDVLPVLTSDLNQVVRRPSFSVLNKSKIKSRFNLTIPYWRTSLRQCLERINLAGN